MLLSEIGLLTRVISEVPFIVFIFWNPVLYFLFFFPPRGTQVECWHCWNVGMYSPKKVGGNYVMVLGNEILRLHSPSVWLLLASVSTSSLTFSPTEANCTEFLDTTAALAQNPVHGCHWASNPWDLDGQALVKVPSPPQVLLYHLSTREHGDTPSCKYCLWTAILFFLQIL